jgi:AcrR family transcriptional regulator
MPNLDDGGLGRKAQTIAAIVNATESIIADTEKLPTTRQIVKKSGYSFGSIYRYFISVPDIVEKIVIDRQMANVSVIKDVIAEHSPTDRVEFFCERLLNLSFSLSQSINPNLARLVFGVVLDHSRQSKVLNIVPDQLVESVLALIEADLSGTFQKHSYLEVRMLLRTMVFMIRTPLLENSEFFGTTDHKNMVRKYMLKMLSS